MTDREYEQKIVEKLGKMGCWAHRFSPDEKGSQPFDVIGLKDGYIYAIDAKLLNGQRFPLSRIEDNQINAMKMIKEKFGTQNIKKIGFAIFHEPSESEFFLDFDDALSLINDEKKSINLKNLQKNKF